ncbi:MAG: hypothetical protein K2M82_03995 [Lachnospiraceae bacterium]|nr:hypothetical protein [Lachnospiraceae bacterium]
MRVKKKIYLCKRTDWLVTLFVTVCFAVVCVCVLTMPKTSIDGAKSGLEYSFGILIPSLFPFMFLSNFAVEYGISSKLARPLGRITEKLFYLPGEAGVTILLSLIGGFPVGASGINALVKQNKLTQSQARRMMFFCVNSGPAFVISVVGATLYNSVKLGVVLLIAQTVSSLTVGIVTGIFARKKEPIQRSAYNIKSEKKEFSPAFITACKNACTSTVTLCALVVLFSTFSAILSQLLKLEPSGYIDSLLNSLFEVTSGCSSLAEDRLPLYTVAMAIGWGGLCVHFQAFSSAELVKVNKLSFTVARLINGLLSSGIAFLLMHLASDENAVFSNIEDTSPCLSYGNFYGSLALFCASILFLIFVNKYMKETQNHFSKLHS